MHEEGNKFQNKCHNSFTCLILCNSLEKNEGVLSLAVASSAVSVDILSFPTVLVLFLPAKINNSQNIEN